MRCIRVTTRIIMLYFLHFRLILLIVTLPVCCVLLPESTDEAAQTSHHCLHMVIRENHLHRSNKVLMPECSFVLEPISV